MDASLNSELVHVACPWCNRFASFSLESLLENHNPACPYCGQVINVDLEAARKDALRQAEELDQSVDSLGSIE